MSDRGDLIDRAADLEQRYRDFALAAARHRPAAPEGFDGTHCTDCDDAIPAGRLATGAWRCIGCQEWAERRGAT